VEAPPLIPLPLPFPPRVGANETKEVRIVQKDSF